jgi:hypothetical protein
VTAPVATPANWHQPKYIVIHDTTI